MRTFPYVRNIENINLRKSLIIPFNIVKLNTKSTTIDFVLSTTKQKELNDSIHNLMINGEDKKQEVFIVNGIGLNNLAMDSYQNVKNSNISIKVSNISLSVTINQFHSIIRNAIPDKISLYKATLVFDRILNISKGHGYISVDSMEDAYIIARNIREVVVDHMKLSADIIK